MLIVKQDRPGDDRKQIAKTTASMDTSFLFIFCIVIFVITVHCGQSWFVVVVIIQIKACAACTAADSLLRQFSMRTALNESFFIQ